MQLSISNIGWEKKEDLHVYKLMQKYGFTGLEIAPTRILQTTPYDRLDEAKVWGKSLKEKYNFSVPSMQSIWYGRGEMLFGSEEERQILLNYTKKAIDFAASLECGNLVLGCPKNRNLPVGTASNAAIAFFRELGEYAVAKGTAIGMEANPAIYNTNYINDTKSALELITEVDSKGFLLNLDVGTMIQNKEEADALIGQVHLINHVHISEPGLAPIEERELHRQLSKVLRDEHYEKYISIEMGKKEDTTALERAMEYVRKVFL